VQGFTRTAGFGPLPRLVEEAHGRRGLQRLLDGRGLPYEVVATPMLFLPIADLAGLFEDAARLLGEPQIGLRVGQRMDHLDYGPMARFAGSAPTLGDAVARTILGLPYHSNVVVCRLTQHGESARWSYRIAADVRSGRHHHATHILPPYLKLFRSYCADPEALRGIVVETSDPVAGAELERTLGLPVTLGASSNGIVFKRSALACRRLSPLPSALRIDSWETYVRTMRQPAPSDRLGAIMATARLHLSGGVTSLDSVAERLQLGRRTLQRCLDEHGMTYRGLIEDLRSREARDLLADGQQPIKQIAFLLGYSDPAHFSRAFRRWTGVGPDRYRRRLGDASRMH